MIGEFDAILATDLAVYLIEAKWNNSPQSFKRSVLLKKHQEDCHRVFHDMRLAWQDHNPADWAEFLNLFPDGFHGHPLAPPDSTLAKNTSFLLARLQDRPRATHHVLLYFHRAATVNVHEVLSESGQPIDGFQIVTKQVETFEGCSYFSITPGGG
ncbi:MAG TPA: hypothetical protein VF590_13750 [Isosphaeraceae bacterium]|jgi:hypothetical protein